MSTPASPSAKEAGGISFRERIQASPTKKFTQFGILPTKFIIHLLLTLFTSL